MRVPDIPHAATVAEAIASDFYADCDDVPEPSRLGPDPRADWP